MKTAGLLWRCVGQPMCDWDHHWGGHSSGGSLDPESEAYAIGLLVAVAIGLLLSLFSGGLLSVFTRRIRHTFWVLPTVNLAAYVAFMLARDYPGGRGAQISGQGLVGTILTILLLVLLSTTAQLRLKRRRW